MNVLQAGGLANYVGLFFANQNPPSLCSLQMRKHMVCEP